MIFCGVLQMRLPELGLLCKKLHHYPILPIASVNAGNQQ